MSGTLRLGSQDTFTAITLYIGQIYELNDAGSTPSISEGTSRAATKTPVGVAYFLPDHLGSTALLLDTSQAPVSLIQYTPFGKPRGIFMGGFLEEA